MKAEGSQMPWREPSWWSLALATFGVLVGWLTKGAVNEARLRMRVEHQEREMARVSERLSSLEKSSVSMGASIATLVADQQANGRTITRMYQIMDRKADK